MSPIIRALAWALHRFVQHNLANGTNPEAHEHMGPLLTRIRVRKGRWPQAVEEWEEALLELLAEQITEGWDRYGAPSMARHPEKAGVWVGSFERPGGPFTVEATSKREAYREARREWLYRILTRP